MPHILRNVLMKAITLFRTCFNRRFAQEVMGVQSGGNSNFENFGTLDLEVLRKNAIWV
jgi:hypothetical protein